MTVTLTVFTDFICPWCYLSSARTARLVREYGPEQVVLEYVHFPLHPGLPENGTKLSELFKGRGLDVDAMQAQMAQRMKSEGLEFVPHEHVSNTRKAQELSAWAIEQKGTSLIDALYRANFVDGADLGDTEVLVNIAVAAGINGDEARAAIESRAGKSAIDEQWTTARQIGVTGVPTFVVGNRGVVGAQPYPELQRLVESGGAKKPS